MSDEPDGAENEPASDEAVRQGFVARVAAILDRLAPRDRAALATMVERDLCHGERPARVGPR
jgi:hypothetical protein